MRLQEFVNPFCEAAENAFLQPNTSISEIAVNLCLKHKTNVSLTALPDCRSTRGVQFLHRLKEFDAHLFQELPFYMPE